MTKFFTGSKGSETITLYDDNSLKITTTIPDQFALKTSGDWESDGKTALTLTLTNSTPFTITVSAIKLQLAVYEPHGQPPYNSTAKNFRVQWDDNNDTTLTLKPANPLGPKATDQSLTATVDFSVNPGVNGVNGDCYLQATVTYKVSGDVNQQAGINTSPPVSGVKGTEVMF